MAKTFRELVEGIFDNKNDRWEKSVSKWKKPYEHSDSDWKAGVEYSGYKLSSDEVKILNKFFGDRRVPDKEKKMAYNRITDKHQKRQDREDFIQSLGSGQADLFMK